jgi:hypothetical protein
MDKIQEYKRKWIQPVNLMLRNRLQDLKNTPQKAKETKEDH